MHSPFFAERFCPHPGSTGTGWPLFSSRLLQILDTPCKILKCLAIPKSTTELESLVPRYQLFYRPFLLGRPWKTHLVMHCIKTAKKAKITFKCPIPFTRPQGQLFCIILSNSFCFRFLLPLRLSHAHPRILTPSFNMQSPRGILCISLHGLYFWYILTRWLIPWADWSGKANEDKKYSQGVID